MPQMTLFPEAQKDGPFVREAAVLSAEQSVHANIYAGYSGRLPLVGQQVKVWAMDQQAEWVGLVVSRNARQKTYAIHLLRRIPEPEEP